MHADSRRVAHCVCPLFFHAATQGHSGGLTPAPRGRERERERGRERKEKGREREKGGELHQRCCVVPSPLLPLSLPLSLSSLPLHPHPHPHPLCPAPGLLWRAVRGHGVDDLLDNVLAVVHEQHGAVAQGDGAAAAAHELLRQRARVGPLRVGRRQHAVSIC